MAGGVFDDDQDEITGINVTPLVDVMLVLLIIFMVTSSYIANRAIEVQLPKAETSSDVPAKNLAFVLDESSNLYLDGNEIAFQDIAMHIKQANAKRKDTTLPLQALIAADEKVSHGEVVKLIDTIRKNGITEFAINVDKAAGKNRIPSDSGGTPKPEDKSFGKSTN